MVQRKRKKRAGWGKSNEERKENGRGTVEKGWQKSVFAFEINVNDGR